jgi:hypothetical protein
LHTVSPSHLLTLTLTLILTLTLTLTLTPTFTLSPSSSPHSQPLNLTLILILIIAPTLALILTPAPLTPTLSHPPPPPSRHKRRGYLRLLGWYWVCHFYFLDAQEQRAADPAKAVRLYHTIPSNSNIRFIVIYICNQYLSGVVMSKRYVSARAFCQINSNTMRAVRKILSRPGLDIAKVAILCGGPDWPTSVLTGIMDLSFWQMLLGTQPIVVLICPCVLAGAFLLRTEGVWDSIGGIAVTVAAVTQVWSMAMAAYYIQEEVVKFEGRGDDDPDFVPDLEVMELDKVLEIKAQKYKVATQLERVPAWVQVVLLASFLTQAGVTYLVGLLYTACFEPFELSSSVAIDLDGNISNVVKSPWGYVAIGVFFVSGGCLLVFNTWASHALKSTEI